MSVELNICGDAEASGSLGQQSTDQIWILENLQATRALGSHLAKQLPRGSLLLLQGTLGAGKTSLVQGLATALGVEEPITSPIYALSQHYPQGNPPLIHLDLYRLEQPEAANELFLQEEEEALALGAVMAIEWPERLTADLPDAWHLQLQHRQQGGRLARLKPPKVNSQTFRGEGNPRG